jgi:predicted phage terminase large subunit-like protein
MKRKNEIVFDELEIVRSLCRSNYYFFLKEFWNTIVPDPFVDNWHIKYIANELQYMVEWFLRGMEPGHNSKYDYKPYDLIINESPGSTKSLQCSVFFQPWVWTRYQSASFIGSSYQENLSIDLSRKARIVLKSDKYKELFPEVVISEDQDAKGKFANTEQGERNSVGNKGGITGRHADFIVIDDPIDPKGSRSSVEMTLANQFITETLWSRKKNKARTPTILVQQRLHANDPTGMMLEMASRGETKIRHLCFPAVLTDDVKPVECKQYYRDGLFDPVRLPKPVLDEAALQGEYSFAGQFLQRPVPIGGGMFKTDNIIIRDRSEMPVGNRWVKRVRYWDKAATQDAGCFTVGMLMGKDVDQRFWILDVVRGRWDSARREQMIKSVAAMDGYEVVIGIEQEPGSGGKDSASMTARNLAGYRVVMDKPSGPKEERADPFSTQVNAGNVYMVSAGWNRPLLDEMGLFPNGNFKDQVDSGSGAFKYLTLPMKKVGGWRRKR